MLDQFGQPREAYVINALPPNHVIVRFGRGIPSDLQGVVMLSMEKSLREMGVPAEVFKTTMADDSKLRLNMTPKRRASL